MIISDAKAEKYYVALMCPRLEITRNPITLKEMYMRIPWTYKINIHVVLYNRSIQAFMNLWHYYGVTTDVHVGFYHI